MTTANRYVAEKGLSTLERPRYSAGLLLEDDDLTSAVDYTRNMMRLMFRSLFGCGVICGLDVTARLTCNRTRVEVTVGRGVALSCTGDPIEIPKALTVIYDAECDPLPDHLWVTVCYREMCCRPRDISCSPDDDGQKVQTRILDGFEVRLYPKRPKCACSCEPFEDGKGRTRGDCCDDEEDEQSTASASASAASAQQKRQQAQQQLSGAAARQRASVLIEESDIRQVPPAPGPPRMPELCECYEDHYEGKCDCECCCPCVFIGKVDTASTPDGKVDPEDSDPQELLVSRDWVRWIRPVLVGYYKCLKQSAHAVMQEGGPPGDTRQRDRRQKGSAASA